MRWVRAAACRLEGARARRRRTARRFLTAAHLGSLAFWMGVQQEAPLPLGYCRLTLRAQAATGRQKAALSHYRPQQNRHHPQLWVLLDRDCRKEVVPPSENHHLMVQVLLMNRVALSWSRFLDTSSEFAGYELYVATIHLQ